VTGERFLVTGALGCLGAWVVHELLGSGAEVVTFDLGDDAFRLRYLVDDDRLAAVTRLQGDVADPVAVRNAVVDHDVTNVIHLAALQMPFCAADPPGGAMVNVVGTVNVFAAVKGTRAAERPIVYSSSVAAYDAVEDPAAEARPPTGRPGSHYGVYKFANEAGARVFAQDDGLRSVGLRPYVVYGVGRDQGKTSSPTLAMLAAARGEPYEISFGGGCQMQYAGDVARAFISAARSDVDGAAVYDIGGPTVQMSDVVDAIRLVAPEEADRISIAGDALPFPEHIPDDGIGVLLNGVAPTPLSDGVADTIQRFRDLIASGMMAGSSTSSNVVR
jgi:nucleoside-diphosphate-sugar epimerase